MSGRPIARVGDSVSANCSKHGSVTGVIQTGSNIGTCDGGMIAREGDTGTLTCGHTFVIVTGSDIGDILGIRIARVNDVIQVTGGASGTGVITSGCGVSDLS